MNKQILKTLKASESNLIFGVISTSYIFPLFLVLVGLIFAQNTIFNPIEMVD